MSVSLPLQGPSKGECECKGGCGRFGTLGRPDKDGRRHVKGCKDSGCRVCLGRNSRRSGGSKQSKAVTALGIPRSSLHPGHEEFMGGTVRVEVKSGKFVQPVMTKYRASEAQSEAQRPIGDHRPFVAVFMPHGVSWGIVAIRTDKLKEAVAALAQQFGMIP